MQAPCHQSFSAKRPSSREKVICANQRNTRPTTIMISAALEQVRRQLRCAVGLGIVEVGSQKARLLSSTAMHSGLAR